MSLENSSSQTVQLKLYSTYYQTISNDIVTKISSLPKNITLTTNAGSLPTILKFDPQNLNNNNAMIITLTDSGSNNTQSIILAKTTHRIRISLDKAPTYLSQEN